MPDCPNYDAGTISYLNKGTQFGTGILGYQTFFLSNIY